MEEESSKRLPENNELINENAIPSKESEVNGESTIITAENGSNDATNGTENGHSVENLTEDVEVKCSIIEDDADERKKEDLDNSGCGGDTIDTIDLNGNSKNGSSEIESNDVNKSGSKISINLHELMSEMTKKVERRSSLSKNSQFPLNVRWQLWYWRADGKQKVIWENALQKVCVFGTVEEFWRLYHHIKGVRYLSPPSDYCVFKEGVKPMWEDPRNVNGGRWMLSLPRDKQTKESDDRLDQIWLETLLTLVGEGFGEFSNDICGAVINIRTKGDKISVWTADSTDTVGKLKIGEILKLRTDYKGSMIYESHTSTRSQAERAGKHPRRNWFANESKRNLKNA